MRRLPVIFALILSTGCGHGEPFGFEPERHDQALVPATVERLTFNPADDLDPAWFPDGDSFIYDMQRLDRPDGDRCLAIMPALGGTIVRAVCQTKISSADSIDVSAVPAPGPDGRVAFLYSTFDDGTLSSYHTRDLVIAPLDSAFALRHRMYEFPFTAPGGIEHDGVADLTWRSPTQLVYAATLPHYPQPCKFCRPDVATPVQVILVELSGDTATTAVLPNTIFATSVAMQGSDTLYFTLLGDGRVFRRVLSTGVETVAHDFGLVIARDVQVRGGRLLAIVGGLVNVEFLVGIGYTQNDDGGEIHLVDLATNAVTVLNTGGVLFRRGALSPDGTVLVAESRLDITDDWDLWRIELP